MSYNNYNNGGGNRSNNNRGNNGYNNGGYNDYNNNDNRRSGGYSNNGSGGNRQPKKKSGCTAGQGKNGKPYVQGWKANKTEGLTNFIAGPYEGQNSSTHQTTSANGRVWENWAVTVTNGTSEPYITGCLYEPATKKLHIPKLGLIMNPKGGPGGYCGKNFTPKR